MTKNKKKNKEYNKRLRRIIVLILVFIFLLINFGAFTYAWFSSNKNATIDQIDINVQTVSGIQISHDAITWDNTITVDQLHNAYQTYRNATNQFPDTLSNVSSDGSASNGRMNIYYGIVNEETHDVYSLYSVKDNDEINCVGDDDCEGRHYVAFDIFLLVTNPAEIGITAASGVKVRDGETDRGSQNAARVGFVVVGSTSMDASAAHAQALSGGTTSYIWEPNYDVHTDYGVAAAKSVYGLTTTNYGAARLPYKGINREFSEHVLLTQTDNSPYFSTVVPDVATPANFTTPQSLMRIPAGITKLRVYLWLEGQDVDLDNSVANGKLKFDLELSMLN